MICITGADGFIGSHLANYLNSKMSVDILCCDPRNSDMIHPDDLFAKLSDKKPDVIYHLGAISSTTETNTEAISKNNILFSCQLLEFCILNSIPLVYASSASVYGLGTNGFEESADSTPLNYYAISKSSFDQIVNQKIKDIPNSKIIGLRYFNVYGNGEDHKKDMASPVHKFIEQSKNNKTIKIFEGSDKFLRDFIHVSDVARITANSVNFNSGIYNVGTGIPRSFKDVAEIISELTGSKIIEIPFPENLKGKYQAYTRSNNKKIDTFLQNNDRLTLESGIKITYNG